MFLDSLIESQPRRAAGRRWTTLVSFALQSAGVAALVLIPLFYTGALPPLRFGSTIHAPLALPPRTHITKVETSDLVPGEERNDVFTAPRSIPEHVDMHPDPAPSGREQPSNPDWNALCATTLCVEGGTPFSDEARNRTIATILKPQPVMPTVAPPPAPKLLTSRVLEGLLIHRVQPDYPRLAQIAHIEGTVELKAVIGKDGEVESLRVVSGHPYLAQAAVAAVRQWRYRPYLLNGIPVEVEAQILVKFRLQS